MGFDIKSRDKRRFDAWSRVYDKSILQHLVFRASHNMFLREIAPRYKESNDIKILDVGCGTGEFIHGLSMRLEGVEIHGMDLSIDMIKKAKAKIANGRIKFKVGDVEELPYNNSAFDIITCSHSFHHYPDKKRAVSEMHRVLKNDGRLMIIDGCRDVPLGRMIFSIVEKVEKHVYHMFAHELRDLFSQAGFHKIDQRRFNPVPLLFTSGAAQK